MVLASIEIILSALHVAPMNGMGRTIVVARQAVGTLSVMLPDGWLAGDVVDRT